MSRLRIVHGLPAIGKPGSVAGDHRDITWRIATRLFKGDIGSSSYLDHWLEANASPARRNLPRGIGFQPMIVCLIRDLIGTINA